MLNMSEFKQYEISYLFCGTFKSFYICTVAMDDSKALYWTAVDAGFRSIPKVRLEKSTGITSAEALNLGITNVAWNME
ncbi:DUF6555 family protein [Pseudomonas sp. 2822-17]|uniref:DUF6555 family protein n=1 Tax=Pseudomonas sp. 2822-17 TaxID=1712678 RepID=UPI0034D27DBA